HRRASSGRRSYTRGRLGHGVRGGAAGRVDPRLPALGPARRRARRSGEPGRGHDPARAARPLAWAHPLAPLRPRAHRRVLRSAGRRRLRRRRPQARPATRTSRPAAASDDRRPRVRLDGGTPRARARHAGRPDRLAGSALARATMITLGRLISFYAAHGLHVRTGLNPHHFRDHRDAPFTAIYRNGKILSTGGGIALQEVYFFECLFAEYQPASILVIGNAFGWSTLLLSLLNPRARVVALDAGIEGEDTDFGIDLTNRIAKDNGLAVEVVKGSSPQDVEGVVSGRMRQGVDFVFVDGLHTELQQELDYQAAARHRSPDGAFVFHDVVN